MNKGITSRIALKIGTAGGIVSRTNVVATNTPPGRSTRLISATYKEIQIREGKFRLEKENTFLSLP